MTTPHILTPKRVFDQTKVQSIFNSTERMIHLTLNSGKSSSPSRRDFVPKLTDSIRPFLDNDGGTFPRPYDAYRIETEVTDTGVAFEYYKDESPISICVGTWAAEFVEEYWAEIETAYYQVTDVCPQVSWANLPLRAPDSLPWLATLLLPGFFANVKSDSSDVWFLNASEVVFFWVAHDLLRS
ncbi:MAG: hypothetical protein L0Z50_29185 [Verrucomicrobiales bacterium]|nr:hypothetical protein [Verrucomicrobiales bacterium]